GRVGGDSGRDLGEPDFREDVSERADESDGATWEFAGGEGNGGISDGGNGGGGFGGDLVHLGIHGAGKRSLLQTPDVCGPSGDDSRAIRDRAGGGGFADVAGFRVVQSGVGDDDGDSGNESEPSSDGGSGENSGSDPAMRSDEFVWIAGALDEDRAVLPGG